MYKSVFGQFLPFSAQMTLKVTVKCHHMQSHPRTSKLLSGQARLGPILTDFGPNDLEGQRQMSPYAIPSKNFPRYTNKPNLVILCAFFETLLSGQARFGLILTVFSPNDLEGHVQMSPYAIPSKNFP